MSLSPTEIFQCLYERRHSCHSLRVPFAIAKQNADTARPVLCAHETRPRDRRPTQQSDELASCHAAISLVLDPDSHARFKPCRLSFRVEPQAKRAAVVISNNPLGLPGGERSERLQFGDDGLGC